MGRREMQRPFYLYPIVMLFACFVLSFRSQKGGN